MPLTKTLYLIRHSKADLPSEGITDFERPLTQQGVSDSHRVALRLLAKKVEWDVVISSPAIRAITTAIIFSKELTFPVSKIVLNESLYESGIRDYLQVVNSIGDGVEKVAIFGHNETISEFATYLTGKIADFPTSGVVIITFSGSWAEISGGTGNMSGQV
jgi:phosphohistidine phosphatase